MENSPFSSHLWMSRYGLLLRNGSSFLGARPLRILQPSGQPELPTQLPTPSWLNASAYNPSLSTVAMDSSSAKLCIVQGTWRSGVEPAQHRRREV